MNDKLQIILKAIDEKKGEDVIVYEFNQLNPSVDYVIIVSADNIRKVKAIADNIKDRINEHHESIRSIEGERNSTWLLVDCNEIIIHVFEHKERMHYQLEKLYIDLPHEVIES